MSMAGDDRVLPDEVADGTVPDPDLATTEIGAKVDADEADVLEQSHVAVSDDDFDAEESELEVEEEA
jgi:hypothetical protein